MDDNSITRREAFERIIKLVALATGLSAFEVRTLLAEEKIKATPKPATATAKVAKQALPNRQAVLKTKSANAQLKALKTLLENKTDVFENEFGRVVPVRNVRFETIFPNVQRPPDLADGMMNICVTNFNPAGSIPGATGLVFCQDTNTCTGQNLTGSGGGDGQPCNGTNNCNGQSCPNQQQCDTNNCQGQSCPKFGVCGKNNESLVSANLLSELANDPYIQLLFKEFNVASAQALSTELKMTLADIASGKTTGWPPK